MRDAYDTLDGAGSDLSVTVQALGVMGAVGIPADSTLVAETLADILQRISEAFISIAGELGLDPTTGLPLPTDDDWEEWLAGSNGEDYNPERDYPDYPPF